MNDMSHAGLGHNLPPSPMELVASLHDDALSEAANWADGAVAETMEQMKAVEVVLKGVKAYRSDLKKAVEEHTRPAHTEWKTKVAQGKLYTDEADLTQSTLVAVIAPMKAKEAAEQAAAQAAAWEAANAARREAEAKVAAANAADLDAQREARAAQQAVKDAEDTARAVAKASPKGMRTVKHGEIATMSGLLKWMNAEDRPALDAFATEYARKNHANIPDAIVRTVTTKEAY